MVLFDSMSGCLLGGFTAGIIVNVGLVVHIVVEGRQVALDERQFVRRSDSSWQACQSFKLAWRKRRLRHSS
jgi:hypothetical protein